MQPSTTTPVAGITKNGHRHASGRLNSSSLPSSGSNSNRASFDQVSGNSSAVGESSSVERGALSQQATPASHRTGSTLSGHSAAPASPSSKLRMSAARPLPSHGRTSHAAQVPTLSPPSPARISQNIKASSADAQHPPRRAVHGTQNGQNLSPQQQQPRNFQDRFPPATTSTTSASSDSTRRWRPSWRTHKHRSTRTTDDTENWIAALTCKDRMVRGFFLGVMMTLIFCNIFLVRPDQWLPTAVSTQEASSVVVLCNASDMHTDQHRMMVAPSTEPVPLPVPDGLVIYVENWCEGMMGWMTSLMEVLVVAKRLNATVVEPCVSRGALVSCGTNKEPGTPLLGLDLFFDMPWLRHNYPVLVPHAEYERLKAESENEIPEFTVCTRNIEGFDCGDLPYTYDAEDIPELRQAQQASRTGPAVFRLVNYHRNTFRSTSASLYEAQSRDGMLASDTAVRAAKRQYLLFHDDHFKKVDELLVKLGINDTFSVIQWRAEGSRIDYVACAQDIIQARYLMKRNRTDIDAASHPFVLMSNLNTNKDLIWSGLYGGKQTKWTKAEPATMALSLLLDVGFLKLDNVLGSEPVQDMAFLAIWDLIIAMKAEKFATCTRRCSVFGNCKCQECNYLGKFAKNAVWWRNNEGKSSMEGWPGLSVSIPAGARDPDGDSTVPTDDDNVGPFADESADTAEPGGDLSGTLSSGIEQSPGPTAPEDEGRAPANEALANDTGAETAVTEISDARGESITFIENIEAPREPIAVQVSTATEPGAEEVQLVSPPPPPPAAGTQLDTAEDVNEEDEEDAFDDAEDVAWSTVDEAIKVTVDATDRVYVEEAPTRMSPIVVESHKLVFFHVPKVACSAWKTLFLRMENRTKGARLHDPDDTLFTHLYDYNVSRATEIMNDPSWTRAMFVRDPHERLVSAYLDKGTGTNFSFVNKRCCKHSKPLCPLRPENTTFGVFVDLITNNPYCGREGHWMRQSDRLERKYWPKINFVGHMGETLHADARRLLERIGAWDTFGSTGWGPHGNLTIFPETARDGLQHQTGVSTDPMAALRLHYTPELERRVTEFYKRDYENPYLGLKRRPIYE